MKTWISPAVQELDVKLTAKQPSIIEQDVYYSPVCGWLAATYNSTTESESCTDCKSGLAS